MRRLGMELSEKMIQWYLHIGRARAMIRGSNCPLCKHFQGGRGKPWVCAAFPQGIPEPIALGKDPHTQPFDGDHGLRFEPSARALELEGDLEASLQPTYERRFAARGPWFSLYTADSWREWFCEAHAAYWFHAV
ncbi:hypothetical protein Mgrana_02451 [Meiothermus granaticius NBRC 107808]|uniref:Uncharacterized protein n=2 Tax=Meiothermus TaxID=65551 RepID=A0A399FAG6_9DEIN|nr:hypothetical protein Mgrana_02451 [Meiothermus granaticius NBRC 107808]